MKNNKKASSQNNEKNKSKVNGNVAEKQSNQTVKKICGALFDNGFVKDSKKVATKLVDNSAQLTVGIITGMYGVFANTADLIKKNAGEKFNEDMKNIKKTTAQITNLAQDACAILNSTGKIVNEVGKDFGATVSKAGENLKKYCNIVKNDVSARNAQKYQDSHIGKLNN